MNAPAAPDVTVLMPVRNGERYLQAALASILTQTLRNFELIVCDDGSTDATPHLLAYHAERDDRIRILTLPRLGLVAALNHGLRQARTSWVARMDADDVAWPRRLTVQMAAARAHPDAGAIGSAWRVIDPAGRPRRIVQPPVDPRAIAAALLQYNCLAHPTMLLRRDAVAAVGGYRAAFRYVEDYDLWLRMSERYPLYAVAEPLLDYREHAGQVSARSLEQRILAELAAQLAAHARRDGKPDPAPADAPLSRAWLLSAGATEADIRDRVIGGALGAAKHALQARQPAVARQALQLLGTQERLHPRTRLHALLLRLAAGVMRDQTPPP